MKSVKEDDFLRLDNLLKEVRYEKLRFPINRGQKNCHAKLTDNKVKLIISLHLIGYTTAQIAKASNVSATSINSIVKNKTWRQIDRSEIEPYVNFAAEIKCESLFI